MFAGCAALGAEVTFTTAPPMGMPAVDEMVRIPLSHLSNFSYSERMQFAAHAEYDGLYTATPVPNPALVALGVQFGTVEEWLEAEVKPRFAIGSGQ